MSLHECSAVLLAKALLGLSHDSKCHRGERTDVEYSYLTEEHNLDDHTGVTFVTGREDCRVDS